MMSPVVFWIVAIFGVASALAVVTARNLVHGALAMVATFALTAVLYLALAAPFIAAVQIIVYAGAIMVLFTFVVMLIGNRDIDLEEPIGGQRPLALAGVLGLGALLAWAGSGGVPAATGRDQSLGALPDLPGGFGSPAAIGDRLFDAWVLPVEVVSVLLLAAMLGVVVIARAGGLRGREIAAESEPGE